MNKKIEIEEINKRLPVQSKLKAMEYVEPHITPTGMTRNKVRCLCACGGFKNCIVSDLIRGNPTSCGKCKKGNSDVNKNLYKRWYDMRDRCYNKKSPTYKNYGAKGVRVCDLWVNDFKNFKAWALANGYSKELELDKDIKGDGMLYSPDTCQWVSKIKNMSNITNSIKYDYEGAMLTIPEISRLTGVLQSVLKSRVKTGLTIIEAVNNTKNEKERKIYSNS